MLCLLQEMAQWLPCHGYYLVIILQLVFSPQQHSPAHQFLWSLLSKCPQNLLVCLHHSPDSIRLFLGLWSRPPNFCACLSAFPLNLKGLLMSSVCSFMGVCKYREWRMTTGVRFQTPSIFLLYFILFYFWDSVSNWPGTGHASKAGQSASPRHLSVPTCPALGLQALPQHSAC